MNILVLCTGNSARSILLETILNQDSNGRVRAFSAGSNPAGKVHPQSLKLLTDYGYHIDGLRSKSWDEFASDAAPVMDMVITVCDSAAAETCPFWPGAPVQAHWGIPDPASVAPEAWADAFDDAYATLRKRAEALLALPFENMNQSELKSALTRIGTI